VVVAAWLAFDAWNSRRMVLRWGEANGFEFTECAFAPTWRQVLGVVAPRQWRFRVVARDAELRWCNGTVWCGGYVLGLIAKRVEVTWDG
jgi:hypothetical protein